MTIETTEAVLIWTGTEAMRTGMVWALALLPALLGVWTTAGCSSSSAEPAPGCSVNDTRQCTGPGACAGGQVCSADGSWGSCDCGNVNPDSGADAEDASEDGGSLDAKPDTKPVEPGACEKSGKCPSRPMIKIDRPDKYGGPFEIDAHETSIEEYMDFAIAATNGDFPAQTDWLCSWNKTYVRPTDCTKWEGSPNGTGPTTTPEQRHDWAVSCVDACDAVAYCKWAGKHLCGYPRKFGEGEPIDLLLTSEWFYACTNGGEKTTVMTAPASHYDQVPDKIPGLFNMAWGMSEWVDPMYPGPDAMVDDYPWEVRGGVTYNQQADNCSTTSHTKGPGVGGDGGFRCCR